MKSGFEGKGVDGRPEARYANYFEVGVTTEEVVIDLGQSYGEGERPVLHTRIVTSPGYARVLTDLLEGSLADAPLREATPVVVPPQTSGASEAVTRQPTVVLRRVPFAVPPADTRHEMLNEAVHKLLTKLGEYLPPPPGVDLPAPSVSVVRLQEKQLGLGQFRSLDERNQFPVAQKGLRVAATTRFQLWAITPDAVEQQLRLLIEALLADREALVAEGFLEMSLRDVTVSQLVPTGQQPPWRQVADFDLLYEFHVESPDDAGGLIARIPAEFRPGFGSMTITGDVVVWDDASAPALVLTGGNGPITGLSALVFAPGAQVTDSVTVLRTFSRATGPPTTFATLDSLLAAVSGPNPASTHASFTAASLTEFLNALGPAGAPVPFVDQDGNTRLFPTRFKAFPQPVVLASRDDQLHVTFTGTALSAGQLLYLRALRGQPLSA